MKITIWKIIVFCFSISLSGVADLQWVSASEILTQEKMENIFDELNKQENFDILNSSLKILAKVDQRYKMLWDVGVGLRRGEKTTIIRGNPFYKDTKNEYQEFVDILKRAKEKVGLNDELQKFYEIAKWRLSYLDKNKDDIKAKETLFNKQLESTNSVDGLKRLIDDHRDYKPVIKAKEKLENILVKKAKLNRSFRKYIISEIQPEEKSYTSSITVVGPLLITEYPKDFIVGLSPTLPLGDNSVHRYKGERIMSFGNREYKFNGDKDNPLTFVLLKNIGYVYLYGKGKITLPDGKEKLLGYDE